MWKCSLLTYLLALTASATIIRYVLRGGQRMQDIAAMRAGFAANADVLRSAASVQVTAESSQGTPQDKFSWSEKVRVLCWVMTSPANLMLKAVHVKKTWGPRCNVLLFVSSKEDKDFPAIGIDTDEGRDHLTAKTMHAFKYVYDHHFNDADWFMKAEDDTYVLVENLRLLLADKNPMDPLYFGHHFNVIVQPQGYNSGGAGYVLSKEALKRFATQGFHNHTMCQVDHSAEDVAMGWCMQRLGVKVGDSYDEQGRSRFHCLNTPDHLHRNYPDWYLQYESHGAKSGIDSISDYAVSFHYVTPNDMWGLEFYSHRLKTYGQGESQNAPNLHPYYSQGSAKADSG